jgi:hypothetical protein
MVTFETTSSHVSHNGAAQFLLTVESERNPFEGHLLCSLPTQLVDFEEGDTVRVTLEVVKRKKD